MQEWRESGKPLPPPHVLKQRVVREYAGAFSLDTLVETGTYVGTMVEAMKATFKEIFSIELDRALYERARGKFSGFQHIHIVQGDSGEVLPDILKQLTRPCLFWLDGHYSGGITSKGQLDTPVLKELECILNHPLASHVILIDDARCFVGENDYPTIEELRDFLLAARPHWVFEVTDDIVRFHEQRHVSL
ncbi:MAG TPA: hypothetical protein VGO91_03300 [Pyrinomonadaceae bacterium]|nr:hypothetical protein [Pyrinomonadaceae bacterium]